MLSSPHGTTNALAASSTPSYGAVHDAATRPSLRPTRAQSMRHATSGLAPSTTLRQSGSLRALFRLTSTAAAGNDSIGLTSTPAPPPRSPARVQQTRSLRGRAAAAKETMPLLRRSLTTSQIPPLVRAMSSVLRLPREEENFRCHICFDDVPVSEAVTLSSCGHRYCTACFKSYLEIKIKDGNVYPVCFHPVDDASDSDHRTCGVAVNSHQIEQLVDAEVWKKFNLFRFNKEHEHARECPHCAFAQECKGPESPECVCVQCGKTFCFFHDVAHEGRSCADYELENAEAESVNRAKIKEIAKPCPGCQRDVEKDGGCNHMKCVMCQTSFCWLCGEIIEDAPMPSHFSDSSDSPCSGKQFDGSEQIELPWQVRVYAVLVAILCYPIAFACAMIFTPFTWCRSSSPETTFSDMFWLNHTVAMIWLALVVSLIFFVVAIVVELTFRLVVFVVMLPFVIIKAIVAKAVSCCRSQTVATSSSDADRDAGFDLEAGEQASAAKDDVVDETPAAARAIAA